MKKFLLFWIISMMTTVTAFGQTTKLPDPQITGGPAVLDAIEARASASGSSFPTGAITEADLATLLWSATGRNRKGSGWTVPTARGMDPYTSLYVAAPNGVFLYDGKAHALVTISDKDIRKSISGQGFVAAASHVLIFVTDQDADQRANGYKMVLAGAMAQNIYLAGQALNISGRYMITMNADVIRTELKLEGTAIPVALMPIGHQ